MSSTSRAAAADEQSASDAAPAAASDAEGNVMIRTSGIIRNVLQVLQQSHDSPVFAHLAPVRPGTGKSVPGHAIAALLSSAGLAWSRDGTKVWRKADDQHTRLSSARPWRQTRSGRPADTAVCGRGAAAVSGWAHAAARAHSPAANMRRVRQTGRSGRAAPQLQQPRMRLRQVLHLCTLNMSWSTMYRMFEMLASVS